MLVSQLRLAAQLSSQQDESPGLGWTFLGGRYESAGLNLAACITLHYTLSASSSDSDSDQPAPPVELPGLHTSRQEHSVFIVVEGRGRC